MVWTAIDIEGERHILQVPVHRQLHLNIMKTVSILTCAFLLAVSSAFAGPVNKECPVRGKAVDGSTSVELAVGFCCGRCQAKFDKDPVALLAKVAETADGKCPISGRDVDEDATSTISIAVCCGGCKGKVKKNPKEYLAKIGGAAKKSKGGS